MDGEISKPQRRVVGRPFTRGVSPNPGGKPKEIRAVQHLCRLETEDNVRELVRLRKDKKTPPAVKAHVIEIMFDRAFGKPKQEMDINARLTLESLVLKSLGEPDTPLIDAEPEEPSTDAA